MRLSWGKGRELWKSYSIAIEGHGQRRELGSVLERRFLHFTSWKFLKCIQFETKFTFRSFGCFWSHWLFFASTSFCVHLLRRPLSRCHCREHMAPRLRTTKTRDASGFREWLLNLTLPRSGTGYHSSVRVCLEMKQKLSNTKPFPCVSRMQILKDTLA